MSPLHRPEALDPSRLVVLALGVGNAFTRECYNACLAVFAGGTGILVDCPAPIRRILADSGAKAGLDLDLPDFGHIILTHLHGDHCNGLEEAGFFRCFAQPGLPTQRLYLLPENIGPLWDGRLRAAMGRITQEGSAIEEEATLGDYFEVHPWAPGEHIIPTPSGEPLRVATIRTDHPLPCQAMRFEFNGQSVGYSADTTFRPEVLALLEPAQFAIHEAGGGFGHTSLEDLAQLHPRTRGRMALIHLPDALRAQAPTDIALLREGDLHAPALGDGPVPLGDLLRG